MSDMESLIMRLYMSLIFVEMYQKTDADFVHIFSVLDE